MLENKGFTLIEALLAFSIYISVLVVFVGDISILNRDYLIIHNKNHYEDIIIEDLGDDNTCLEKVLRS